MKRIILLLSISILIGCAVQTINQKKNLNFSNNSSDLAKFANAYFWKNFHEGNYEKIDSILYYLNASYTQNPNDLEIVNHLGFTHIWALSESQKLEEIHPDIIDHAVLSLKYFGESYQLNPKDPRILGFVGDLKMTVAAISDDEKLSRQGYFNGKKSINQWKEFNYFTVGYVLSRLHQESWQFEKGLEWQWKTLDECYCEKFDRENPDIQKYLSMEHTEKNLKRKRACWNSWIAPHNIEGFFLNMGDMLVKSGNWQKGVQVYNLAKQVPQYKSWEYKKLLENRIESAEQNVSKFRMELDNEMKYQVDDVMLVNSSISCMACHQMSTEDIEIYKEFNWDHYKNENNIYFLRD